MSIETLPIVDGRRIRGNASRRAILEEAVNLASTHGLEGLSIGFIAQHVGGSKSGVVALFGNKRDLQLATIAHAREIFITNVVEPTLRAPRGILRLWALCRIWLKYSQSRIFAGGCFFRATAAEVNSRSGPLRDALVTVDEEWIAFVERCILLAADDLPRSGDPSVLAFELISLMDGANSASLLHSSDRPYQLAVAAMRRRLIAAGANIGDLGDQ